MRVRFYVQGTRRQGTVYAEVKEVSLRSRLIRYLHHMHLYAQFSLQNASGNYDYSYLYVTVNHVGTIVIEDNQGTSKTRQDHESTMDFNLLLDNQ